MELTPQQQKLLRTLPGVDRILDLGKTEPAIQNIPQGVVTRCIRQVIDELRTGILENTVSPESVPSDPEILNLVKERIATAIAPKLRRVVNATGVIVHTNLGRSLLAETALENLNTIGGRYSNLEFDLSEGKRGSRYSAVEDIICEITGAEAAMVVNNNAGAVLLCLETLAKGRKVVVSRGELVEIGGAFRIPDVMAKSGGILVEVGTTNRTHLRDYESAIDEETALLLKVHKSNYSMIGFTAEVSLNEMAGLGSRCGIPVMEDLGSGTFVDFSAYGLAKEPTVQESVNAGADIITFSGDKLLGGPQAGIIIGKKELIDTIRKNPINRALRIDKLTLAALESTLRLYRNPEAAVATIPTLRMMTDSRDTVAQKTALLASMFKDLKIEKLTLESKDGISKAGGGALPLLQIPTRCLAIRIEGISANALEAGMRNNDPPIIGRIEDDLFTLDPRTVEDDELPIIATALKNLVGKDR